MSAIALAKQAYSAFNRDKPHSSITEWVEILTSRSYEDEAYDGIPELVESINIQATGPAEASRAIRKKLKHGDAHQQYRALVILKALVENGGHKFQTSFADSQLTDAIRMLATDAGTDPKVKKKLLSVLASWNQQFKDDPSMSFVANLFNQVRPHHAAPRHQPKPSIDDDMFQLDAAGLGHAAEQRRQEELQRKEEKRKAKEAKEAEKLRQKKLEEEKRRKAAQPKTKRKPFNYEEEKPQILTAIANASTASNNLINAITLVNTEHDSLQTNERVQECLQKAKLARKQIVRYVQLVENEEMIGTLIETNDRIIASLETYDTLSKPTVSEQDVTDVQNQLAAVKIQDSELGRLQEKQRAAVQRSMGRASGQNGKVRATDDDEDNYGGRQSTSVHPDLQDLSFGSLGADKGNLPPPMRPTSAQRTDDDDVYRRGSLSDFSDYSSDEGAHNLASSSAVRHDYPTPRNYRSDSDDDADVRRNPKQALLDEDPFADPFMDPDEPVDVGTPGISQKKLSQW